MTQTPLILVIDDDAMNREVLEAFLNISHYRVAFARNGKQGLAQSQQLLPTLILLDLKLPDLSGYEVCRRLKADPATQSIPIIIITGYDQPEDEAEAYAAGAQAFLARPFISRTLLAKIQELLHLA